MTNQAPLTDEQVVRAYRDADFRDTLTTEQILYATNHPLAPADAIPASPTRTWTWWPAAG